MYACISVNRNHKAGYRMHVVHVHVYKHVIAFFVVERMTIFYLWDIELTVLHIYMRGL